MAVVKRNGNVETFKHQINKVTSQVDKLEKQVHEIENFFLNCKKQLTNTKCNPTLRDDKGRQGTGIKRICDDEAPLDTMQGLICQFGTILNQITQQKSGRSSLDFTGAEDLGLNNSDEVTGRPKDFNAIRERLETKGTGGYKHVREIYADVRSILKAALNCNDERSDAYITAKTLMGKFEEKWFLLLPKVMQEENRQEEEAAFLQIHHAQMAKDICNELHDVEVYLNELKECVVQRCRRMTALEKRELGKALAQLSADNLRKALEIVAHCNPRFQATAEEVDLDIDAQVVDSASLPSALQDASLHLVLILNESKRCLQTFQDESTLRQLKCFVLDAWRAQGKPSTCVADDNHGDDNVNNYNAELKRPSSDVAGKTTKKRPKK